MRRSREAFLADAGWSSAARSPVAGDLSTRRYTRLSKSRATAILMECDPETDSSLPAFVKMTNWLLDQDLSAPKIYEVDVTSGFALLEDFGDAKLTSLIANDPTRQKPCYETVLDTLIAIRNAPAPDLSTPSARELCDATNLADDWYPGTDVALLDAFRAGLEPVLQQILATPPTVSLRDFHADNIIWLPDRAPIRQPGILDYQDAFLTHPAYDLMSLLTDARIAVSPSLRRQLEESYCDKTGDDPGALSAAVAALGAQRNLRILGIFARAARSAGKKQHLNALPRVYQYLIECCEHPSLAPFANDLAAAIPPPTARLIEGLSA